MFDLNFTSCDTSHSISLNGQCIIFSISNKNLTFSVLNIVDEDINTMSLVSLRYKRLTHFFMDVTKILITHSNIYFLNKSS